MTDHNNPTHSAPLWWTLLRVGIIFLSGIFVASILYPALRTTDETPVRTTTNASAFSAILKLEQDVGSNLLQAKSELVAKIDAHSCANVQYDQTSFNPDKPDRAALRAIIDHSVVFVSTDSGSGTGFFIAPGKIVTNAHVVDGSETVLVYSSTLYQTPVRGTVIATTGHNSDELGARDYALIDVNIIEQAVPLQISTSINELDTVISAGFPGIFQGFHDEQMPRMILRQGEFINELPQSNGNTILAHSAQVFPGNSGGPLLNECGQVVGINTFIIWSTPDGSASGPQVKTDFALPGEDLAQYVKSEGLSVSSATSTCN